MPSRLMIYVQTVALIALLPFGLPSQGVLKAEGASYLGAVDTSRTLTIYKAECPPGYTGDASADECDANPVPGVAFRIGRPSSDAFYENVPTDAEGLVAFEFNGLPLDGTLRVIEELPTDTGHYVAYCVNDSGDPLDITYVDYTASNPNLGVVDVAVGEQGNVACDWYNVPVPRTSGEPEAARQSEVTFELGIVAANCEREPTSFPFQGGDCVPADHVSIVVTSTSGEPIGTCITSTASEAAVADCTIRVPMGMTVMVAEDLDTVRPGYTPTLNPQSFDVPVSPSDGVFGGPVFLNLPPENTPTADAETTALDVQLVGNAQSWIVPFEPGWGDIATGRLMFGKQVQNASSAPVLMEVIFSGTTAEGTPIQCSGLAGPNIWETIAPHETAYVTCSGPVVPNTIEGIRVLAQLWNADPYPTRPAAFTVSETTFASSPALSSPMETVYEASTLISSKRDYNVDAVLLFRFYDAEGIQVGTCSSDWITASPDFTQQATCAYPLHIDSGRSQPVRVEVESRPPIRS